MKSSKSNPESFTERQSIQVIKEMIMISQSRLKTDGILFIVWGWLSFMVYITEYTFQSIVITHSIRKLASKAGIVLFIVAVLFTVYYLFIRKKRVTTYIVISLRYVWVSLICCLILVNLIQFNVMHEINFNLQHPIFMVFIAFATVITGGILRYRLIVAGGIFFALLAFISSYLPLKEQLLMEAIAWLIAFVIPGHLMYHNRKK